MIGITLNMLQEQVIRKLSGGDIPNDSPYDPVFAIAELRDAIREDLKLEQLERKSGGSDDKSPVTQYVATYVVAIKFDKDTQRAYAELPEYFNSMKYNRGIRFVGDPKTLKGHIKVLEPHVIAHLPHSNFEDEAFGYYSEGLKIFWMKNILREKNDRGQKITEALIKLITAAPESFGLDDVLPILPENVARIKDRVALRLQNKFMQDRLNDGNPNLRQANEQAG